MEPFTLTPACKDYLWGGRRLKDDWGMRTDLETVAESWELSAHPAGDGVVADGPWAGRPFSEAVRAHPEIVSRRHGPDDPFPLLVKLIDARLPLSVQVHPDDAYAARVEHGPGKTEMWLVLDHEPGAFLYVGFERELTREKLERRIGDGSLTDVLHRVEVRKGDRFFIPAGTIHAIGGGILIAEVQQSSDLTYRVFDYGRTGPDGRSRPLHVAKALDVMRPGPAGLAVPGARPARPVPGGTLERLANCPHFRVELLELAGRWERAADRDTFHALLCLDGTAALRAGSTVLSARKGASLFVPADAGPFALEGSARFLLTSLGDREKGLHQSWPSAYKPHSR